MIVDTLKIAILGSLNCMLSIYHLCLRLGLNIKDFKVLNGIKAVSKLLER